MLHQDRQGVTPGAHLRAEIEHLGLDQVAVAEATGVSRQTINNIVNDRQNISRAMAAKLGRLTGRGSDYWLRARFPDSTSEQSSASGAEPGTAAHSDSAVRPAALLVNHQIIRAVDEGFIVVDPFDPKNVQLASLDLTLHDFIITTEGDEIDITEGQSFILEGGQTVNVSTREWLEFPLDYVGRVGAMTRLAKFGIIMAHGFQVDPGYQGHLQFCLFNAGRKGFVLRSGEPIISLEIMPLNATPAIGSPKADLQKTPQDRTEVVSHFRGNDSNHAVRDFLRGYVKISDIPDAPDRSVSAKIPELDIEILDSSRARALASAVGIALDTLKIVRSSQMHTMLGARYEEFFDRVANRLSVSADQVQSAIASLGLVRDGPDRLIVKLRGGAATILQLPRGSAKITLKNLARQLHLHASDLILMLTGVRSHTGGAGGP